MRYWLVGCLLLLAVGCSRKSVVDGASRISIVVPAEEAFNSKISALAHYEGFRKKCYAVVVSAADIVGGSGNACTPKFGLTAGFVAAGGSVDLEIPNGTGRKFELYMFLQKPGENNPCPVMSSALSNEQLAQTYLVGVKENIALEGGTVNIEFTENFPGLSQHLAQQSGVEACKPTTAIATNPVGFQMSSAQREAFGANVRLRARAGQVYGSTVLTGSNIKLLVK